MASLAEGGTRRIRQRYEVVETVGRGGEGTVVKALDTRHDRWVALKIRRRPPHPLEAERMMTEVRTLLALAPHPGLPVVRDDFFEDDHHVLVLDWIDGIDLGRVLATNGAPGLPVASVLRWAAQVAEALTHLHRHDPPVVHGDVKPANLLLDRHGRVVCVDFGVSSMPGRPYRGGTPGFRAPELTTGREPSPAADIYGLAATVFALLTGEPPSGVLPPWDGLAPRRAERIETALRHGLAIDPGRRPATVGELVELLRVDEPDVLPTGTVTALATEIVGFARLWRTHPLAMPAALARHDLIVDLVVEQHDGRRLGGPTSGDATMSLFSRAADAVQAAVRLNQRLLGACDPAIAVRVGAQTGELVGPDRRGPTINQAAQICRLAGSGQVLLSAATARLVAADGLAGIGLVPLGAHDLDDAHDADSAIVEEIMAVSAAGLDVPPDPALAPYPGLVPFSADDGDIYVGRDDAVAAVRELMAPGRVVAVLGASGSGKSSLLRAGLLPLLPGASLGTPGSDPLAALDAAGDGVVLIDQLEELITASHDPERQRAFAERLCAHPAGAVVSLRTDALAALARFPRLADEIAAHHVLLTPLRPDQLRAAIEVPAERRGLQLEPGLVELVLADAGHEDGALPLVAHAMRETWSRREGRRLTVAGYQAAGGVRGAIASSAEAVYTSLDAPDRDLIRAVLLRMVQPGDGTADSRRRVGLAELHDLDDAQAVEGLIARLAAARLVTVDHDSVQPAHESLLRAWPRYAGWIAERRDDVRRHHELGLAARSWDAHGRDAAELYRGARLDGAVEHADRLPLTGLERSFLDASVAAHEDEQRRAAATTRRLRRSLTGVAVALAIALVASAVAGWQLRSANDERNRAEAATVDADVARLAAEARAESTTRPDLAMLLAVEANQRRDTVETRSALLGTVTAHPQLLAKLHGVESGLEAVAWSPDGALLAAPTSDSTGTLLWDGRTFRPVGEPLSVGGSFHLDFDATFTPDGRTLAVVGVTEQRSDTEPSVSAALQAFDVGTRAPRSTVALDLLPESVTALDDTHVLVTGLPMPRVVTDVGPEPVAARQVVDLAAGSAGPVERLVADPVAATTVGGRTLALAADGTLTIADATPSAVATADLSELFGPDGVTALAYDPTGPRLALALGSGSVVLADLERTGPTTITAVRVRRVDGRDDLPSAMSFSPDGRRLAVGGYLGSTRLVDADSGAPVGTPFAGLTNQVNDVAFSPDGTKLAVAGLDGTGSIWSLDGSRAIGEPIAGHTDAVVAAIATSDGETLLTASFDGSVVARTTATGAVRWRTETGEPIWTAALDPAGTRLAVGGADGRLSVLAVADGTTVVSPVRFEHPVEALAWSPTAPLLAVGADRAEDDVGPSELVFVDPADLRVTGTPVVTVGGSAVGLAFAPDGTRLAVVLDNNLVRIVDVASRALGGDVIESVDVPFFAVAWSPDGARLATGTSGGTVQLWDPDTLERAAPTDADRGLPIRGLAFSPDGSVLASTTEFSTSQLWDGTTGARIGGPLVGGAVPITISAIPAPDRPEIPFVPSFRPDGQTLYAGGDEPMTWSLDPARWRTAACTIAGRDLTDAERTRYLLEPTPARPTCPV